MDGLHLPVLVIGQMDFLYNSNVFSYMEAEVPYKYQMINLIEAGVFFSTKFMKTTY